VESAVDGRPCKRVHGLRHRKPAGPFGDVSYSTNGSSWDWRGSGSIPPVYFSAQPVGVQVQPGEPATFNVGVQGGGPISYQWLKDAQPLANGGHISGADTATLRLDPASVADIGRYSAKAWNDCTWFTSIEASLFVVGGSCYANCDQSTMVPLLTANDFMCYLRAYVSGSSYANCDGVGGLTAGDFICFLSSYTNGC
jgi:hypothetical protein